MSLLDDIKDEMFDLTTLQMIAQSFTEAAAARIKGIRQAFEKNQEFYVELSHVYHLVKVVGIKKGLIPAFPPAAKSLTVAYTSNQHFYGNINRRIMETVMKTSGKDKSDLLLVGKTAEEFMMLSGGDRKVEKLRFAKDIPNKAETEVFLNKLKEYTSVMVYYPHFVSLMRQEVGMIDICQVMEIGTITVDAETYILFEPEVDQILGFFERQIRRILFNRVLLESDLARTAARMVTMNDASDRAREMSKQKHTEYLKIMRSFINRQLLDTFAGRSLWKSS
jgi:F-type H+-transporting ATPase subunit gamma